MKSSRKPRASTIGTPLYHRKRRDWRDDRSLLEEISKLVNSPDGPYGNVFYEAGPTAFREKIALFRECGYEGNTESFFLAMWIREFLSDLLIKKGNYDLRIHPIDLPDDIEKIIREKERKSTLSGFPVKKNLTLKELFPDPKLRAFALERIHVLHRGDTIAYLSSLVSKEKESLMSFSATIMDLINICEHKLQTRRIQISKRFSVEETDLWIPHFCLGVEVRNSWSPNEEIQIIRTLSNSNLRLRAKYLALVTPDDFSDELFLKMRDIEKREVFTNLSVIRVGDFGNFIDKIVELEDSKT